MPRHSRDDDRDAGEASKNFDGKKKRKTKSALSLDVFSRAKRSTYDKRVVLEKRRNLAAAKVNKYRKTQARLGDSVKVNDAFDPEKYAARLDAFEKELPRDDGFGRGKKGRRTETDFSYGTNERSSVVPTNAKNAKKRSIEESEASESDDSDGEFRDNVVFPKPASDDEKQKTTAADDDDDETTANDEKKNRAVSNKGWNKAVKDGLKNKARREEKEREMSALREKWAAENAAKRAFFERRDATRDKFRKKNARGQPVMRHRVDKILEQLQKDT